ncbi:MAG: hypothetical protein F6K65_36800 [Moorea sp. SIO3C2]|nr:hypothetical protein [Moorena sp. SIO3C2]
MRILRASNTNALPASVHSPRHTSRATLPVFFTKIAILNQLRECLFPAPCSLLPVPCSLFPVPFAI